MSIASEISRLQTAKAGLKTAIEGKGVTVSDTATLDAYPALVESIQTGGSGGSDDDLIGIIERSATSVTVPEGCTKIGDRAFYYWRTLTDVDMPETVTYIGSYAFYYCTSLTLTSLPSGVTYIGDSAFGYCLRLALTSLPSGVTYIGSYAFDNCTGLTSITFESTPKTISSSAFQDCTNLKTINVPWASGAVSGAPWGATNATINYNYTGA